MTEMSSNTVCGIIGSRARLSALALTLLFVGSLAQARSPYLNVPGAEGQILWSSESDFGGVTHGDVLVDLEVFPWEWTAILPGGENSQLIAVYYGLPPEIEGLGLPQKGLDALDVIELLGPESLPTMLLQPVAPVIPPAPILRPAPIPKIFFSTEVYLTPGDAPPLFDPWSVGGVFPITDGDLLTNSGVVIPNYVLLEPFDLYYDPGFFKPVFPFGDPWVVEVHIGLDAVDVEGIGPEEFNFLTELVWLHSQDPSGAPAYGRLNEVIMADLPTSFAVYFSFEEWVPSPYMQATLFLGPQHRIADPLTGVRLPDGTPVSDDDLLMIRLPYTGWRATSTTVNATWPSLCDGIIARVGHDNIPALGGGDLGSLFRDTNTAVTTLPLGLDATDSPATYDYILDETIAAQLQIDFSDEAGETGAVGISDALLGYSPFSMTLFSTSIVDFASERTEDASETSATLPAQLFPAPWWNIWGEDLHGSDSVPFYPVTNPPNPDDGVFRGVEENEKLAGWPFVAPGLDAVDVVPADLEIPTPEDLYWKDYNGTETLDGYMPDFDQRQDPNWQDFMGRWSHCGPVAEANSLWWFHLAHPDWGVVDPLTTPGGLVEELAVAMRTNTILPGTDLGNFYSGIQDYLTTHGLTDKLEVHFIPPWNGPPYFWEVEAEIERCQDVVLLLGFWLVTDITWAQNPMNPAEWGWQITWAEQGGHYVTCAGVNSASPTLAISDPRLDAARTGQSAGIVRGPNHPGGAPVDQPWRQVLAARLPGRRPRVV
ncbi:hypothetical protein AMJ85_11370 [candidate division BRC1 bacterium SM23_51]|nr:MAG: hypothetical protein AMJ85_11370 [candidate division BRC1 bacterium SM23_51]